MATEPLEPAHKAHFQRLFVGQAQRGFLRLSMGMGIVAFALPIVLVLVGGYDGHFSISYFYHVGTAPRNVLVGALWAIGVFLFLFQGLSRVENWLLNIAGASSISVAMNPMSTSQCSGGEGGSAHGISAIVFFGCLAVVAIGFSKERVRYITDPALKQRFRGAYTLSGVAMLTLPALVAAAHLVGGRRCDTHWIFWAEAFGIWAFATYWFVKTLEYRLLLDAHERPA